jgi:hypothetical protein
MITDAGGYASHESKVAAQPGSPIIGLHAAMIIRAAAE